MLEADDVGGFGGLSVAGSAGSAQGGSSFAGSSCTSGCVGGAPTAGASSGGAPTAGASGAPSAGASSGGTSSGGSSSCVTTGAEVCDGVDNDCNGQIDDGNVCPCSVQAFAARSYLFCRQVADWRDAQLLCSKYGYHLASIRDAAADRFLGRSAASIASTRWWIGLNDLALKGRWAWQAGTPVSYVRWAAGEPNDTGGVEDCVELNRFGADGGWNDEPCDGALPFVCESGGP